jgi:hypothetical protein
MAAEEDFVLSFTGEETDNLLKHTESMKNQTTEEDGETVQVYDTNGVPHKVSKTELLKKSTLALPALEDISSFVAINAAGNAVGVMTKEQVASVLAELVGVVLFSFEINFSNSENGGGTIDDRYTYKFPGVEFSISDYTTSRFKVNHNIASRKYSISITKFNRAYNDQEGEPTAEVYYAENSESSFYITSGEGKNPANILVTVFGIK